MWVKFISYFIIISGVFFLIKPNFLRRRIQKKSQKYIRKLLFTIFLLLAVLLISSGFKIKGFIAKIIIIIGFLSLIKALLFLKSKVSEKIITSLSNQPIIYFRIIALAQITIGVIILLKTI
ncbi:MAG: hypothetical protein DRP80_04635 [Candidatus Omnitrophota bacterium]|nr:MAG: hypothetical protein DRP80_04635 [Candidatus Omnitrophota bacterium]